MPNWKKVIVSGSDAVLNEITASGGILTSQDIMPDSDNTLSLGSSTQRFQLNGGTPVTVTGSGTLNYIPMFSGSTEIMTSSIFHNEEKTEIIHDNDGNDIFIVSGSNGELIKVTDTISDTLFQVNDGSGISQFEVSSSGLITAESASFSWIQTPELIPLAFEFPSFYLSGFAPWAGINATSLIPFGYNRWYAPYDGYIKEIIVHPHQNALGGNLSITPFLNSTGLTTQTQTISSTAGASTTYTFGATNYSFDSGDHLSLFVNRTSLSRASGYSFNVVLILNVTQ